MLYRTAWTANNGASTRVRENRNKAADKSHRDDSWTIPRAAEREPHVRRPRLWHDLEPNVRMVRLTGPFPCKMISP